MACSVVQEHRARTDTGSSIAMLYILEPVQALSQPSSSKSESLCSCGNLDSIQVLSVQLKRWPRESGDWIFPSCMYRELSVSESKLLPTSQFGKSKRGIGSLETCLF